MEYLHRLLFASLLFIGSSEAAQVAIIIDDIGYKKTDHQVLELPPEVTLSILPFTPLGKKIADKAHTQGHDIMLHIPMQSLQGNRLGIGGLDNEMNEVELKTTLERALANLPYVKGLNNHMGSLLTQLPTQMHWTMSTLEKNRLFFIDSNTTKHSIARSIADEYKVPHNKRHVFLDNNRNHKALESQFKYLLTVAKHRSKTIAIAHPHKETLAFLINNLHRLRESGVELVPASKLFTPLIQPPSISNAAVTPMK